MKTLRSEGLITPTTNGQIFLTAFPETTVKHVYEDKRLVGVMGLDGREINFDLDWWLSPHKKGTG